MGKVLVTGHAEREVAPDKCTITLTVETKGKTAAKAAAATAEEFEELISSLSGIGFDPEKMTISGNSTDKPSYGDNEDYSSIKAVRLRIPGEKIMENNGSWKYCVVGNILKTRVDEHLEFRNGTAAFKGGAKVYLNGRYHSFDNDTIDVIGLTRGHRFQVISVPVQLIEHVRMQRVFKPKVLEIMNNWEFHDTWWHDMDKDRDDAALFVAEWNKYMNSLG